MTVRFRRPAWGVPACFAFLLSGRSVAACQGQSVPDIGRQLSPYLANPEFDIYVIRVLEMASGPFSNGTPPVGTIRVDEVLRGAAAGKTIPAVWLSPQTTTDFDPPPTNRGGTYTPGRLKPDWYTRPVRGPQPGDRLIVLAVPTGFDRSLNIQMSYPYSSRARQFVLDAMAPAERSDWTQRLAFLSLLACPFLSFACWRRVRMAVIAPWERRSLVAGMFLLPFPALAVYGYYESGISIYSNIRIDVLVLWPSLAVTIGSGPAWVLLGLLSRRKAAH